MSSATGGFLRPTSAPIYGQALDRVFHGVLAGVTGIPADLVRPTFQQSPPRMPGIETDWLAFAVNVFSPKFSGWQWLNEEEVYIQRQVERLDLSCVFYGPNAELNASNLASGLYLLQNTDSLISQNMRFIGSGDVLSVPELINERYFNRSDVSLTFSRDAVRVVDILSFASAQVEIDAETQNVLVNVTE